MKNAYILVDIYDSSGNKKSGKIVEIFYSKKAALKAQKNFKDRSEIVVLNKSVLDFYCNSGIYGSSG